MNNTPSWGRYSELRPHELAALRARAPAAYLPWGGLICHGPHLPLGLDTIIAEAIAERAVRRTGGVVLPAITWPLAMPHPGESLGLSATTLRAILAESLAELAKHGWRVIVVISGSYSPGQELLLIGAAEQALANHRLLVLAVPPLALVDDEMLDHGALWESSVLLALRPDLIHMEALGAGPLDRLNHPVVGRDPRGAASASLGNSVLNLALERISSAVEHLLASGDPAPLQALYARRREYYRRLTARYGDDLEALTAAWWQEVTGRGPAAPRSPKTG
ncbi:MAG: creatininase family protein [Oscillochloridaceae bacterium]|nr:creatininase family protein [Chloroflexaceae bacterium]MDW8391542.1 creatininase family protein [Oscillochloridaceae bacterium]